MGSAQHLVMPGLVNAHHHIGVTHPLGGCMDGSLELWLSEVWARRDVDPYLDTLWGATQLLRSTHCWTNPPSSMAWQRVKSMRTTCCPPFARVRPH